MEPGRTPMPSEDVQYKLHRVSDGWPKLASFLIIGYLCFYRSFAYLGLPWLHIYIGELSLVAFIVFNPITNRGSWLGLTRRVRSLKRLWILLTLLLLYGLLEALRGVLHGYPVITAFRDTAFNYYPLFIFFGIWVGLQDRLFLRRLIRKLAWFNGCYGVACVLFLSRIPWTVPGTENAASPVPLFSEPSGAAAIALLGLIAYEPNLRRFWYLIALNAFVLLGLQVRGEWLGFAVGALTLGWLTGKLKYVISAAAVFAVMLSLMYATHLALQTPKGRGENVGAKISADYLIARAIAPLSQNLAERLAPAKDVRFAAGTTEWRLVWWANIWEEVHAQYSRMLIGFGYGYPIGNLNPDIESGTFIQTPHNDFLYALAFSGWLGVVLFVFFQVEVSQLLWRSYRLTRQPFGFVCWVALVSMSLFEPFFEGPFGAIPFFLLLGASVAPVLVCSKPRKMELLHGR